MATTLAPVDSREVVRCDRCHLVQFQTNSHLCRRCHVSLDEEIVEVAAAIRSLRHRNGLSQRQLAMRMNVPRTYVSKIENEKATPTLSSLARLARALEVTIPDLLNGPDAGPQEDVRDLLNDNFIAEL